MLQFGYKLCLMICQLLYQMALKPVFEELNGKVPYGLLEAISVGMGDVVSDLLQKTLDNVSCINYENDCYSVLM